ncbi:Receptor-like protein 12 [Morella rubra]|uniref:Receptor-like protein 12 n=1 Tax=Morella rubra TaxID=262757 RepID=A0A6A1US10_9ROSI|nr:Receptor-like protein 12 [Morella rubra]
MSSCFLSGPIDSSLRNLRSLSILILDFNDLISAPVPEFFAEFENLTTLSFRNCNLKGKFPEKIFQVPKLQMLDVSENRLLQGSLPEFPPNGSLRTLLLRETSFSGTLPHSIGKLKMLSTIDLSYCRFNGTIPKSMESLTRLEELGLSYNNFSGPILSFNMAKKLAVIALSKNLLTGQITFTRWEELLNLAFLDLNFNSLEGSIPVSLFYHPSLEQLLLSENQFSGQLDEFSNVSSHILSVLDLSSNNLEGAIPMSIFDFQGLQSVSLSSNNFNGSLQLNLIQQLANLEDLNLSDNSMLIEYHATNSSSPLYPQLSFLDLASGNLKVFPDFLKNQSKLYYLGLSDNQIHGEIPNWIWNLRSLFMLNLSCNYLVNPDSPLPNLSNLFVVDLRSNQLQGPLPILKPNVNFVDFSWNNFSSNIPINIGNWLPNTIFFSLASNRFHGSIPESICNAAPLEVLDLSNNSFSGAIPRCLTSMNLGVLDLKGNSLTGTIPDTFSEQCALQTLDVNGNLLDGKLPESLANCTKLEVLDIGNIKVEDAFPCYLKNLSMLHVLVLRSNNFYGPIGCPRLNSTCPMLQILDLASK